MDEEDIFCFFLVDTFWADILVCSRDHSPVAKDDGDALLSIRLGEKA